MIEKDQKGRREVLRSRARELRRKPTKAESLLRTTLRQKGLRRMRRRLDVGNCLVNLALPSRNLIVEIDGPTRKANEEYCKRRSAWFSAVGFNVLRFTDDDVLKTPLKCADRILAFPESESTRRLFWKFVRKVRIKNLSQVRS